MNETSISIHPELSLLGVLNLVGAAQGLLLALALLTAKGANQTANRLLAALTVTISIIVSGAVVLTSNYVFFYPHLSRIHHPFVFAAGPLLFLYLRELTSDDRRFARRDFLHFLPFVVCSLYLVPYFLLSGAVKIEILSREYIHASSVPWYYVRSSVFFAQFLIYLVLVVGVVVRYRRKVRRRELPIDRSVRTELLFFVIASLVLWIGAMLRYFIDAPEGTNLLVPLGASLVIYVMGYLKIRRPKTWSSEEPRPPAKKYERSTLTTERAERYLAKVLLCMREQKPFTDGDLTLQTLAADLSIPPHQLSQIINERLGKTFSDFISSYRVDEAKLRMGDPAFAHMSLLGIAEDVGFSSKSSFNSVFKKITNLTPSEYRNSLNGGNAND
jgi:AraC-like DNA-binding protein/heme/copper-type cytochrome/quinol oxidase subunit 2